MGFMSRAQRKHIENCKACQSKRERSSAIKRSWAALSRQRRMDTGKTKPKDNDTARSDDTLGQDQPAVINIDGADDGQEHGKYVAKVAIGGMTCASCTSTITKELTNLDFVQSADVNLMTNNARVVFLGNKHNSERIVEAIEDVGYEAFIDDVAPLVRDKTTSTTESEEHKVTLSIEGMVCGSCVGTITRGVKELPFVRSVNVDLVGNRGDIVFEDKHNLDAILQKIDDLGYDATVMKLEPTNAAARPKVSERTVQIRIEGMYCELCPGNVVSALHAGLSSASGTTYTITPSDEALQACVYHPPTLEERSRRMQRHEQKGILLRLVFTGVVAIPTFIIGVVYMSLVPKSNPTRQWWEEPILAGNTMRIEWALFFMTTPVMFFGTDIFHTRAAKEIRSIWRRKSKVPILRRFYRFGSMNLLISAGA